MKMTYAVLAAGTMLAASAVAQEEPKIAMERLAAQVKMVSVQGGIMGRTVKGAPYSGTEISESNQMLADGTRIHNETQTQVFRDSEGRMRRETGGEITIWDPVANASWVLNTKQQTARKLPMGNFIYNISNRTGSGEMATFTMATATPGTRIVEDAKVIEMKAAAEAKMKNEIETHVRMAGTAGAMVAGVPAAGGEFRRTMVTREKLNSEPLGKRTIEGVNAEGTRTVSTIEAGAIGNDRPIQSVTERWFSADLQTVMLTRNTDPRNGEEVFKLVNVNRSEPAAYLFQVPAGFQIIEAK